MLFIPYRVKNPPKSFPIVTLCIIVLNVIVYIFTTDLLLVIKMPVINDYAYAFGQTSFFNFFSACFLHLNLLHIFGNMLFLWVFGPAVEDRLGKITYIIVYFTTGFAGMLLQAVFDKVVTGEARPCIGASGCIMGIIGAYWYLFPRSKVCVFYWLFIILAGVWEVQAIWIIGLYFAMDVLQGMLSAGGGVANFAHVGGVIVGLGMCAAMQVKRDNVELSEAKAIHADAKNLLVLPLSSLKTMLADDPKNSELIRAVIRTAVYARDYTAIDNAMSGAGVDMVEEDPALVAHYLVDLKGQAPIYQPRHLLRLSGLVEQAGDSTKAIQLYKHIITAYPSAPETETALFKLAQCFWRINKDAKSAKACLEEMQKRFPYGSMTQFAKSMLRELA